MNCEGGGRAKKRSTPLRNKITFVWGLTGGKRSKEDSKQSYLFKKEKRIAETGLLDKTEAEQSEKA